MLHFDKTSKKLFGRAEAALLTRYFQENNNNHLIFFAGFESL